MDFAGTGFILAPNIFVTCAHCVPDLPDARSTGCPYLTIPAGAPRTIFGGGTLW
jgi:hypothetical protein